MFLIAEKNILIIARALIMKECVMKILLKNSVVGNKIQAYCKD